MSGKSVNIFLITILIFVSVLSIWLSNWFVLVTNVFIVGGVLLDIRTQNLLMKENVNIKLVKFLQKSVPVLYTLGALSLII